jgi:hypothetical protein
MNVGGPSWHFNIPGAALAAFVAVVILSFFVAYVYSASRRVAFRLRVNDLNSLDLEQLGAPTSLQLGVGGSIIRPVPDQTGSATLDVPWRSDTFVLNEARWRGFELVTILNEPVPIGDGGIVVEFGRSEDYIASVDKLEEVKGLAKRFLCVNSDEELESRLGLAALPEKRLRSTELQACTVVVRNQTSEPIIATLYDCDEFIWKKPRPFTIVPANIGTELIQSQQVGRTIDVFNTMSAHNKVFAVLVSWRDRIGTRNWYKLAGFVRLEPRALAGERVFAFDVVERDVDDFEVQPTTRTTGIVVIR